MALKTAQDKAEALAAEYQEQISKPLDLSNPGKLPLKDLPREVAHAMLDAKLDGQPMEILLGSGKWVPAGSMFEVELIHRLRPVPLTKPSVDWSVLHKDVIGIARDQNGEVYAYTQEPYTRETVWVLDAGQVFRLSNLLANLDPGTCHWKDSWVDRPEGV